MKAFKLYVTDWAPNGTRDLIICDADHQIQAYVPEAVFGGYWSALDSLGNLTVAMYGESIGLIEYSDTVESEDEESELLVDAVLSGEYSDMEPVAEITVADLERHLACSPLDPNGDALAAELAKHGVTLAD